MKLKNILCGILVCGAFCACSDQEPENSNKPGSFDGKAYLRVNITDANSTRATGGDLEYGDATEHEVVNADFFFYDTNGIFIARANVWDSGTENEDNPAGNIEFFGKSVIVLKGLTETNHPKHLVTVLNTPEDFEPANTLDEMKTLLAGSIYNGSHFTMSTTSYGRTSAAVPYFVTEVSESDFKKELDEAQILMLPGGFSGGDEPDGSAKFIAAFFRNPSVADAVNRLLNQRDGLALGICNGFQALIKLGLVPYGEIRPITESDPTLTFNTIHRHQSMLVRTRVASNKSPWLSKCDINDEHLIAISHGEGRFVCNEQLLNQLIDNGQIATQYVDLLCRPTMDMRYNPNGSVLAIEGITSPDGRVFGKMGHSERSGEQLYKNVTGDKYQPIFEGGVNYFKL